MKSICLNRLRGFSLMELLVVMAVVAILAALVVPAMNSILASRSLDSAGAEITGSLTMARQMAITTGNRTRWEIADLGNGGSLDYRIHRISEFKINAWEQVLKWSELPAAVRFDDTQERSSIVTLAKPSDFQFRGVNYEDKSVIAVEFFPDGSTSLALASSGFLTLMPSRASSKNWLCIVINPVTGTARSYRP